MDTERASGYRYWPKAYLVQLHREGSGTVLVHPIALEGRLGPLQDVLNGQVVNLEITPSRLGSRLTR